MSDEKNPFPTKQDELGLGSVDDTSAADDAEKTSKAQEAKEDANAGQPKNEPKQSKGTSGASEPPEEKAKEVTKQAKASKPKRNPKRRKPEAKDAGCPCTDTETVVGPRDYLDYDAEQKRICEHRERLDECNVCGRRTWHRQVVAKPAAAAAGE